MVKTIKNLDDLQELAGQNPQKYNLGELVREIVALNIIGLTYSSGNSNSQEGKQQLLATIENRANTIYAELDRRERVKEGVIKRVIERQYDSK